MSSLLDQLRALLPPPESVPSPQPWRDVENRLGVGLPSDYKEFMNIYGDGTIGEFLMLMSYGESFDSSTGFWREDLEAVRQSPEDILQGVSIEEEVNILPWAYTINGDVCYWLMDPWDDPDRWHVVSRAREMDWACFEGAVVEFFVDIISGVRREPWFPLNFPGESPRFKTTAQYLADRHGSS